MPAWCQRENCRRYGKFRGMCLYHARDVYHVKPQSPSTSSSASSQETPVDVSAANKVRRGDARWSAIAKIRYHHTGWIKCLVPLCSSEARRHFPFCTMHENSTLCVHEATKQYLKPTEDASDAVKDELAPPQRPSLPSS
ncbi:hypothetical protein ACHHYP_12007 [Achlya hypogyna]|uniref:Uncharacterized protein n=1 Tax=Achlya hypogyna TaxID=1202772 RepID=A0A1V9YHU2_ACHHY|nr:hypothetical protein ACHHYP_12007 [Achlya hypogyna]